MVDIAPQHPEPRIAPSRSVAHQMMPPARRRPGCGIMSPRITLCHRGVIRVMPPRLPDDPLRGPIRRVRSPCRGASKVDVMLWPERPRHIVTRQSVEEQRSRPRNKQAAGTGEISTSKCKQTHLSYEGSNNIVREWPNSNRPSKKNVLRPLQSVVCLSLSRPTISPGA